MRHRFLLIVAICVALPFAAYAGKIFGFWVLPDQFDTLAHLSASFGLALGIGIFWYKIGIWPFYWSIVIPVLLIGGGWETVQFLFGNGSWFINDFDTIKDLSVDVVGAMIGAIVIKNKPM